MTAPDEILAPDGARVLVYQPGAQVGSWKPAGKGEQLFTASRATPGEGKTFKGGIPICWPQFGPGPLPQHGFARDLDWERRGPGVYRLDHAGSLATRFPHHFDLTVTIRAGGSSLEVELAAENKGTRAWFFTGALHTYLSISDVDALSIEGLAGAEYLDKTAGGERRVDRDPVLRLTGETDRVYLGAAPELVMHDGPRTLTIASRGFADVVIWNPWSAAPERFAQFGPDDYRRMVCIEAAVVAAPVALEKGQSWSGSQTLSIT